MAGDWIKVQHTLPDKPEVVLMASILGLEQDSIVGKLIRVWSWADQNSVSGNAIPVTFAFLDRITACAFFGKAMREVGWLTGEDKNLSFPNFDRHNGETAKSRMVTNIRVAKHRAKSNGNVTENTLQKPLPEKRREESYIHTGETVRLHGIPKTADEVIAYGKLLNPPKDEQTCRDFFAFYDGIARTNPSGEVFWVTAGESGSVITNWKAKLPSFNGKNYENSKSGHNQRVDRNIGTANEGQTARFRGIGKVV